MTVFRAADTPMRTADTRTFSGPTFTKLLASSDQGTPVHMYRVEFDPGGRTNWHAHSGPQWLFVVEGRIRVQGWQQGAHDLEEGDAVVLAPGEKHWHGAVPGARGVHIAVNIDLETTWLEPVSDEQYGMERQSAS
jgi:quercetin dioxygenase-like cupin family protein